LQATYASKMDAVSLEYTHLLTSQLDSQRQYYEELRAQDDARHHGQVAEVQAQVGEMRCECEQLQSRCGLDGVC
jgi:hypothetical protein